MTIPNRTVAMKGVFAQDALTTIPTSPVVGTSYRNTGLTATEVKDGWPFKEIVDSAKFNEFMYEQSTIASQLEKYGFLPWSNLTDYVSGSLALGSNGKVYVAQQATGPSSTAYDPVNDTTHTYWKLFIGQSIGSGTQPVYTDSTGAIAASTSTVGATNQPVFLNAGTITACPKSDLVGLVIPDYSSIVSKTKGTEYTAETNGYLSGYCVSGNGEKNCYVYVDNIMVRPTRLVDVYQYECWWFPVKKGSTYSVSGSASIGYNFIPALGG